MKNSYEVVLRVVVSIQVAVNDLPDDGCEVFVEICCSDVKKTTNPVIIGDAKAQHRETLEFVVDDMNEVLQVLVLRTDPTIGAISIPTLTPIQIPQFSSMTLFRDEQRLIIANGIQLSLNMMLDTRLSKKCCDFVERKTEAWPIGLATALRQSLTKYPTRHVICDDSQTMQTQDGKIVIGNIHTDMR